MSAQVQQVDKSKFVLVQHDHILYDESIKTKSISYYKDAWLRFKKNRASVVAFVILVLLILMTIIGPMLSTYKLDTVNNKWAQKLKDMPAKIEGLEWIPLFSGEKELFGYIENFSSLPDDVLLRIKQRNADGSMVVVVDYYRYIDHFNSDMIDPIASTASNKVYLSTSYQTLTIKEYEAVKAYEAETGEQIILEDGNLVNGTYRVRVKFYKFLEAIYGVEEPAFWFGSTGGGADLFYTLWKGARLSLLIAFGVALINIIIGVIIGSISGYYGGTVDLVIERLSELLSGLPFLAIITLLILRFGSAPWVVVLAFTLTGWLGISALTRTQFYRYKGREYVLAARTLGAKDARIMYRHILPNAVGTLITSLVLYVPSVIFSESSMSYLGIINYPGVTSVGTLLANGQAVMKESFYQVVFPALFISLLMLAFNLFGNGLRDAFNPSLRGVEE
ncbi:MAG TPA: ABC transporter permease [Acholeplasma sp.]|jgi:oligopeptide transport system permease protein|nr:ABC transporter permease [Acholeplasma sp.]